MAPIARHARLVCFEISVGCWVVSGSFQNSRINSTSNDNHQLCCFSVKDKDIDRFWDLELIGISSNEKHNDNELNSVVDKFHQFFDPQAQQVRTSFP